MAAPMTAAPGNAAPISTELDADGVLLATINMAGRTMNVFSQELMDALDGLMDQVDADAAIKSCVITSGKASFLAGADLAMVRSFCDAARGATHETMFELCGRLGRQFVRLEASTKPYVAAVNGLALGGGLELALACRTRLVADDPRLQLGVPEVRLGLLPGAGGTQRLPRMIGFEPAMDLLLTGRSVDPATAFQLGFVSAVVPAARLLDEAKAAARALVEQPYDVAAKFRHLQQQDVPASGDATGQALAARAGIGADDFERYPAYSAIVDSVLQGARQTLARATTTEMHNFLRLMFSPVAGRMVRTLFLERQRAEREWAPPAGAAVVKLRTGALAPAWEAALAKLRLLRETSNALAYGLIEVTDGGGAVHRAWARELSDAPKPADAPQLVLAPPGAYGRVIEIVGGSDAAGAALGALATRLWSLPWRTPGPLSRLSQLANQPLPAQAQLAAGWSDLDGAFIDVAACLAGLAPAWSGGPLTWAADAR